MPIAVSAREANENRVGNTFPEVIAKPFYRSLYFGSPPARGARRGGARSSAWRGRGEPGDRARPMRRTYFATAPLEGVKREAGGEEEDDAPLPAKRRRAGADSDRSLGK